MCLRHHVQMVQAFTKAPASVDGTRGGRFRLLDGNVLGVFTDLVRSADAVEASHHMTCSAIPDVLPIR